MTVLVVGGTGQFGTLVIPALLARGHTVRCLVRGPAKAEVARSRGAHETVTGDLSDPMSLRAAVDGVDGVFALNPVFVPEEGALGTALVEAAVAAGVDRFVFSSVSQAASTAPF